MEQDWLGSVLREGGIRGERDDRRDVKEKEKGEEPKGRRKEHYETKK